MAFHHSRWTGATARGRPLCQVQPVGLVAGHWHVVTVLYLVRMNLAQPHTAMQLNVQVVLWQPYPMTTGDWTYGHRHIVLTAGKMHKAFGWVGRHVDGRSHCRWETMAINHKAERDRDLLGLSSCCSSKQAGRPLLRASRNSSSFPTRLPSLVPNPSFAPYHPAACLSVAMSLWARSSSRSPQELPEHPERHREGIALLLLPLNLVLSTPPKKPALDFCWLCFFCLELI